MEELVKSMMAEMRGLVEAYVPEEGEYEDVSAGFENPDNQLVVDRFWLSTKEIPKGIEKSDIMRGIWFFAQKRNSEATVRILLMFGTKQKLLNDLQSPEMAEKILDQTRNLSYHLIDL